MVNVLLLAVAVLMGIPVMQLSWSGSDGVRVEVTGRDSMIATCAESGLEVRYRFSLQLCERRRLWWDDCGPLRSVVQAFRYSPVAETFHLVSDRHGDEEQPKTSLAETMDEAFRKVESIRFLPLEYLGMDETARVKDGRSYLRARLVTDCKGERSETLDRLSSIISFGLVSPVTTDTGWITYALQPARANPTKVRP